MKLLAVVGVALLVESLGIYLDNRPAAYVYSTVCDLY